MSDEPQIALASSPRAWAQRLHRHVADHGGARVRATVLTPHDALEEAHDVFLVDDCTSFLSRRLVTELHARGRAVLGVHDPDDTHGKGELLDCGVDDVVSCEEPAEALLEAIRGLAGRDTRPFDVRLAAIVRGDAARPSPDMGTDLGTAPVGPSGGHAAQGPPAAARGPVVAVAGAGGGVGATEVALALAGTLGETATRVALVDADDVAPALAQRVGGEPYPNLHAAVDAWERGASSLDDCLQPVGPRLDLLAGLSTPTRWADHRPADAQEVVTSLSGHGRPVVVNVGPRIEDVRQAGGPARYRLTRQLLAAADVVVVVTAPSPVGVTRLLEWSADLRLLAPESRPVVVCNRAPARAYTRAELGHEVGRSLPAAGTWFVPEDRRVTAAAWAGEAVAPGPFSRAVQTVAREALDVAPPRRRRPWRRRRP